MPLSLVGQAPGLRLALGQPVTGFRKRRPRRPPQPEGLPHKRLKRSPGYRNLAIALLAALPLVAQVTTQDLLTARDNPANWLTYNGDYAGHRHSGLTEITPRNAGRLTLKWAFQGGGNDKFETTPLVFDGVMYLTYPPNEVYAVDPKTGVRIWHYNRALPPKLIACCGLVNRGLAARGDRLFLATLDAHIVALDRKTGRVLWEKELVDYSLGYSATLAPLVVKDKVLVGVAGGEYGIRGFIDAYNVEDGKLEWRFYTVPGPGEFGHDTWAGDSWKTGGASIWITPSYDPEANLTYWGVGNPGPDWNGDVRLGDNLFSDAVVALDADTGERKWHFQFTPHDVHDWDAVQVMVLLDKRYEGRDRKLLVTANRNGFYYVLDRLTGEFLHGSEFARQTWAEGLDNNGRPIRVPGTEPTAEGNRVYPMVAGGTNWMSPTYSPLTGLLYVTCREGSSMYYKGPAEYRPGTRYWGSMFMNEATSDDWYGAVRALDPLTGNKVWEHRLFQPAWAGLLSTAGGLVFAGTQEGYFKALDAKSGKELWRINLGGRIYASPMAYQADGHQHIAIAAGSGLFVFTLP
ncbi:MAG: PQQ-dependent dehydrogenase, methanol/ethanol family [bacterium]|nr:PQQ-dependent dehydrogenase, methanol/ethanol family [bacterium]